MKYGNRGPDTPGTETRAGWCYITSQNHGFQVGAASLLEGWHELFVSANDGSNEGIYSSTMPSSSQFHPESTPGPRGTEFLFDVFIENVGSRSQASGLIPIQLGSGPVDTPASPPPVDRIPVKIVLVLGSGGLSIGQAGGFDDFGSQAIKGRAPRQPEFRDDCCIR